MGRKSFVTDIGRVVGSVGAPIADDHFVKAQLVAKIVVIMRHRGLKQTEAADLFGVKQPDVSKMVHGELRQFSIERLLRFLVALGQDVEIVIKPPQQHQTPSLHVH